MRTAYRVQGIPDNLQRDVGRLAALIAAGTASKQRTREQFLRARQKYSAKTQPRMWDGRFRKVLARLKQDLGASELNQVAKEINAAEKAADAGDYQKASAASQKVIGLIDEVQAGVLDRAVEKNLREGAADLGRVLAYLPLPQGENSAKVRFSDLPPSTGRLIQGLLDRVSEQINANDAAKFTKVLRSFISGVRTMSSDELSAEMNKLLRLLSD